MPEWQVIIYASAGDGLTEAQLETIGEAGRSLGYQTPSGRLRVSGPVEADSALAAAAAAEKALAAACRRAGAEAAVREVRVLPREQFEAETAAPRAALAGVAEAAEILGVARQRIPQLLEKRADFPRPVTVLKSGPVWEREQVEAFGRTWSRRPGRPRKSV
jgi:hypothetical protein